MKHVRWPLEGFENVTRLSTRRPRERAAQETSFPCRYMRYWFGASVLRQVHASLGRPLKVLEVGVDRGDLLAFMGGRKVAEDTYALPDWIERWDGFDVQFDPDVVRRHSYSNAFERDIESPSLDLPVRYDAIVLLHVLEHLLDPEAALDRLLQYLEPNGVLVGGSPTMPGILGAIHEPQLRRKYAPVMHDVRIHKHLSVISPQRLRHFARAHGLTVNLLTGTFFLRASGSPLENSKLWVRANLAWGALFPSLGGEVYFSLLNCC